MKCHLFQKSKHKNKLTAEDKRKVQGIVNNFINLSVVCGVEKASEIMKQQRSDTK